MALSAFALSACSSSSLPSSPASEIGRGTSAEAALCSHEPSPSASSMSSACGSSAEGGPPRALPPLVAVAAVVPLAAVGRAEVRPPTRFWRMRMSSWWRRPVHRKAGWRLGRWLGERGWQRLLQRRRMRRRVGRRGVGRGGQGKASGRERGKGEREGAVGVGGREREGREGQWQWEWKGERGGREGQWQWDYGAVAVGGRSRPLALGAAANVLEEEDKKADDKRHCKERQQPLTMPANAEARQVGERQVEAD